MSLELRGATVRYGQVEALANIELVVERGEPTALVGASGSGKSTALRLLAGLEAPERGEVWIDGARASGPGKVLVPPHRRGLSMVFQDLALWPNLTALENAALGLSRRGLGRHQAGRAAREALALCGIEDLATRSPGTLSGGQQQRVALARAIAGRPAFLLLDEPFAGLDLVTKARLLAEVSALSREQSLTLVLVTHDPFEAAALCRSVAVLEEGQVVESGPLAEVLRKPRSEILSVFQMQLGAVQALGREQPGADLP